ncbi:MAG: 16S rRNA (cytidine(1402)-2'-O)-methyltransferase [Chitinophagales bacterium]|nr:16S rRNA (cytidine(1402)-2'-O)-methyltransferase [Chitinophagales bacterium]
MSKLYVIPTPIGNLEDVTFRAIRLLKEVDEVYAEDTRQSQKLLRHYGIDRKLYSYHKFSERKNVPSMIDKIRSGMELALISDAGTPGISDPGFILVKECVDAGIEIDCLPGPVAFVPALVMSGIDTSYFTFVGFLPHKKGRQTQLQKLNEVDGTLVLYESPHRIVKSLTQLKEFLGDRNAAVVREISKIYQETVRGSLSELIDTFENKTPKGEFVIVIADVKS